MDKSNKPIEEKPTKPADKQRGIGVIELLFTLATIGATVVVGALGASKRPPLLGD